MPYADALLSVVSSLVLVVASVCAQAGRTFRTRARLTTLTAYLVGLAMWPLVWRRAIGSAIISESSWLMGISLAWPLFSLGFEVYMLQYTGDDSHAKSKRSFLLGDGQSIISLTLAFASMLSIYSNPANARYSHIFVWAIIGCILVVMQTSHTFVDAMCLERIVFETAQKVCLVYSTGLLVGGIVALNDAQVASRAAAAD